MKDGFANEDLERENEIKAQLEDKLDECDQDVNGDRNESGRGERSERSGRGDDDGKNDKNKALQARKRQIIASINKMVNQFNENNKLIKEANKVPKNEKEMCELIARNKEIQDDCRKIDDRISLGKAFAEDINDRLDGLMTPTIPDVREKYTQKNATIDQCDEAFDKANAAIGQQEEVLAQLLDKVNEVLQRLETVNPIDNPTSEGVDNSQFLEEVHEKLAEANKLRDKLEGKQDDLAKARDSLINTVQPLNELGDREVLQAEVDRILEALKALNAGLLDKQRDLLPTK